MGKTEGNILEKKGLRRMSALLLFGLFVSIGIPSSPLRSPEPEVPPALPNTLRTPQTPHVVDVSPLAVQDQLKKLDLPAQDDLQVRNYQAFLNRRYLDMSDKSSLPSGAESKAWVENEFAPKLRERLKEKAQTN
jgi:hypothetical protein